MTHKELVERLAIVARAGREASTVERNPAKYSFDEWAILVEKDGIRAVLVELAKMGAGELPSTDDIMRAWWSHDGPRGRDSAAIEHGVYNMLCSRVAPILAAKDAELATQAEEIERLRRIERAVAAWLEYETGRAHALLDDPEPVERQIGAARNRAAKQLRARLNEASAGVEAPLMTEVNSIMSTKR